MATVRINDSSHRALRDLADTEKAPLQTVLERAIENYRRQRFLEAANRTYAALRNDPATWQQEQEERELWDKAASDGPDD
jgi:predicted transcriptional regulator